MSFSIINHPAIGVTPFMETPKQSNPVISGRANHGGARCFRRACSTQKAEHLHSQCAVIWMPFLTEDDHTVGTTHAKRAKDGTKSSRIITDHPGSSVTVRADFSPHNLRTRHCCITPACAHMEFFLIGPKDWCVTTNNAHVFCWYSI